MSFIYCIIENSWINSNPNLDHDLFKHHLIAMTMILYIQYLYTLAMRLRQIRIN